MSFLKETGERVNLNGLYKDQSAFFVGSGPSLQLEQYSQLYSRGIFTFAVNNVAARTFRPNFWCCADEPRSFHANIWNDPTITKFCPYEFVAKKYFDETIKPHITRRVRDAPNILFYNRGVDFKTTTYFTNMTQFDYGCPKSVKDDLGIRGGRSVMLVALKILFVLGFRTVYLVGCDFKMGHDDKRDGKGKTYAFSQYKHPGGVVTNNQAYKILSERFQGLLTVFDQANFKIFNCTPNSQLTVFPTLPLSEAIVQAKLGIDIDANTQGYYGGQENLNRFGW